MGFYGLGVVRTQYSARFGKVTTKVRALHDLGAMLSTR